MVSPIELMIDRACGFDRATQPPRDLVSLHCPDCGKTIRVDRDIADPPSTAKIEIACNKCSQDPERAVKWFNAKGQQINVYGEVV